MRTLLFTALLTGLLATMLACSSTGTTTGSTITNGSPTEAYKQLYAAVKSKNTDQIKGVMSKKTQAFAEMVAARQNEPIDKVFQNGFTATTYAETLPEIRDERIGGEYGAVEVWNAREKKWEDLGFVYEDGAWKFAVGEVFGGTFKSPGKGRAMKEQEAANAMSNNVVPMIPTNANANTNANIKVIVPKARPEKPSNK